MAASDFLGSLTARLAEGEPVANAYARACEDAGVKIVALTAEGDEVRLRSVAASRAGRLLWREELLRGPPLQGSRHLLYVVVGGGELEQIPEPACVEARLPKGRRPTREEIEEAIKACTHAVPPGDSVVPG